MSTDFGNSAKAGAIIDYYKTLSEVQTEFLEGNHSDLCNELAMLRIFTRRNYSDFLEWQNEARFALD